MTEILPAIDIIYGLLFTFAVGMAALTHREIKAARGVAIAATLLLAVRWGVWAFVTDQPWYLRALGGALVGGFIFGAIPAGLQWISDKSEPGGQTQKQVNAIALGLPVVRFGYLASDLQVKWPQSELLPQTNDQKSPFAIIIKNVGKQDVHDLEVAFSTSIETERVKGLLTSSRMFADVTATETGDVYVPLEWVLGKPSKTTAIGFGGENKKRLAVLSSREADNAVTVNFPPAIKNILSVVLLDQAYTAGEAIDAEMRKAQDETTRLLVDGDQPKIIEHFKALRKQGLIRVPDVTMHLEYKDMSGAEHSQSHKIRALYNVIVPPRWVFEDVRQEKRFFEGGLGILSFEDDQNPDEGLYNSAKHQGLIDLR
jgi:hypothetical protein